MNDVWEEYGARKREEDTRAEEKGEERRMKERRGGHRV